MKPYFWAVLTALTWGCVPIIEKMGLVKMPVWAGLICRSMGVVIGIALIFVLKHDEIIKTFKALPAGWHFLIIGGFLASIVGQIFFYIALKHGEASKVVPLSGAYPLVAFLLGILFLKETVTISKLTGVALVIAGVVLLH